MRVLAFYSNYMRGYLMRNTRSLTPEQRFELVMEAAAAALLITNGAGNMTFIQEPFTTGLPDSESRVILTYLNQREELQSIRLLNRKL